MGKVGVMHLIDTLEFGGAERVAVNLVNQLPRDRYDVTLCSTRADGPLAAEVASDVTRLSLRRRHRFDSSAVRTLAGFVRDHNIGILHAHGTSLFLARLVAAMSSNQPRIVWHDHYGPMDRPVWLYRLATRGVSAVLAVNAGLADWAKRKLLFRAERVWYVPNFVCPRPDGDRSKPDLPGIPGSRIACVANIRPEKDHLNLVRAMQVVARQMPAAHLLLLGGAPSSEHLQRVKEEIEANKLGANVTLLGVRDDVPAILRSCDVGVLGSYSEGLPLSLLEYGMAGLPTVATSVGQCPEVLDGGRAGILVPPKSPESLAHAILFLLESPQKRAILGRRLEEHIRSAFNPESITDQICCVYDTVTRSR